MFLVAVVWLVNRCWTKWGLTPSPLIGSDDVATPYWAEAYEEQIRAGTWAVSRAAPRTVAVLGSWAWRASPFLTVLAVVVQLVAAVATALGLLATASVFTRLLANGPTPDRVVAALPALALVVAAVLGRGLLQAGIGAVQAALVPRIVQCAQDDLYAGLLGVELLAFDDPDFTALVERASRRSLVLIQRGATLVGDLLTAAVSVIAAVVAVGVLHPLLAPLVLVTALPQAWASLRRAQVQLASFLRTSAQQRRQAVTGDLISDRVNAAEIRAFTTQQALLDEHRRITAELTREVTRVGQHRNLLFSVGRALSAFWTMVASLSRARTTNSSPRQARIIRGRSPRLGSRARRISGSVSSRACRSVDETISERDRLFRPALFSFGHSNAMLSS